MNKKAFTIIETLIVVVMMTTALLIIYRIYNLNINNEKKRLVYDDVVDIYKINNIKNYLVRESNISLYIESYLEPYKDLNNIDESLGYKIENSMIALNIGVSSTLDDKNLLFNETEFNDLIGLYDLEQLVVLRTDFEVISGCSIDSIKGNSALKSNDYVCRNSFSNFDINFINYVKSLGNDKSLKKDGYILIGIFKYGDKNTYANIMIELEGGYEF